MESQESLLSRRVLGAFLTCFSLVRREGWSEESNGGRSVMSLEEEVIVTSTRTLSAPGGTCNSMLPAL